MQYEKKCHNVWFMWLLRKPLLYTASCISKYPSNEKSIYYCGGWDCCWRTVWLRFKLLHLFCSCIFRAFDSITSLLIDPTSKTEHLANNEDFSTIPSNFEYISIPDSRLSPAWCWWIKIKLSSHLFWPRQKLPESPARAEKCAGWWRGMTRRSRQSQPWSGPCWCGKLCGWAELSGRLTIRGHRGDNQRWQTFLRYRLDILAHRAGNHTWHILSRILNILTFCLAR